MPDINTVVVTPTVSVVAVNSSVPGSYDSVARLGLGMYNAREYGAVGDGVTDDTAAIVAAIAAADDAVSGATGAYVLFPQGTFITSSQITLPNRVSLIGANDRGTIIKAASGHTGPWMFHAVNGTSSMFGSRLVQFSLNCNSVAGLGGILAEAWQENSGLKRVVIQNFRTSALKIQTGYGGAAYTTLEDIEFYGSTSGATYGIDLQQVSAVGGFQLVIDRATITGGTGGILTAGINVAKDSLLATGVHFENVTNGILLDGLGSSVIVGLTGSATNVTDVIEIASGFTGRVTILGAMPRSATNTINNAVTGEVFTGNVNRYTYPDLDETNIGSDRGDASVTLTCGTSAPIQRWATTLTQNRTVTLATTAAVTRKGARFRIVRTGLGNFTLDVGGLKTIPSATAAFVDVAYDGSAWVLIGYGTL